MSYGNPGLPSKNFAYGAKPPVENVSLVEMQLVLAHRYRNKLVEIEKIRRGVIEALRIQLSPRYLDLLQNAALAEEAYENAREVLAKVRSHVQAKVRPPVLVTPVVVLRAAKYTAERAVWAEQRLIYKHPGWKAGVTPIYKQYGKLGDQVKAARASSGLYWGTYLFVENSLADREKGDPPRFQSFNGNGTLAVQIQHGLPVADAFTGTSTHVHIDPVPAAAWLPGGHHLRRTKIHIRIGSDAKRNPIWTTVPYMFHRPFPTDAVINWVYLQRRSIAGKAKWSVRFAVGRVAGWAKTDCASEGTVGIDVGWRVREGKVFRVAYWAGSDGRHGEFAIPDLSREHHVGCVDPVTGKQGSIRQGKVQIPALFYRRTVDDLQSIRETNCNIEKEFLANWKKICGVPLPTWFVQGTVSMHTWRRSGRLVRLVRDWSLQRFPGDTVAFDRLETWRKKDKHLYLYERNQEETFHQFRKNAYWNFVADLRRQYHTAHVEALELKKMQDLPAVEDKEANETARKNQRNAACASLLSYVRESFAVCKRFPPQETTMMCHLCGVVQDFDRMNLVHTCVGCGKSWDQDYNAAMNLLHSNPATVVVAKPRKPKTSPKKPKGAAGTLGSGAAGGSASITEAAG